VNGLINSGSQGGEGDDKKKSMCRGVEKLPRDTVLIEKKKKKKLDGGGGKKNREGKRRKRPTSQVDLWRNDEKKRERA